jgi:hypothetical protein
VLRGLGWEILRVWSADWWIDHRHGAGAENAQVWGGKAGEV